MMQGPSHTLVLGTFSHLGIRGGSDGFRFHAGFEISQHVADGISMPDSFISAPSRYLVEMLERADAELPFVRRVLIFNPRFRLTRFMIQAALAHARHYNGTTAVISGFRDSPLAYLISVEQADCRRLLLLLSCSSARIDRTFLESILFAATPILKTGLLLLDSMSDGFLPANYRRPMEWCASHASRLIGKLCGDPSLPLEERIARRNKLPVKAFFTHHAGDVFFCSLAANDKCSRYYDEIIVHENYREITRRIAMKMPVTSISGPVPFRGEYRKEDPEYFLDIASTLSKDALYAYCRTMRNYNFSDFHHVDHVSFCLGLTTHGTTPFTLPPSSKIRPIARKPTVLLHFDAGWPLKVYPQAAQRQLANGLLSAGYTVVVLDAKHPIPGTAATSFETLDAFDVLLDRIDVLVGMDSFPAHYAAGMGKCRTIHLFGSTHPTHSEFDSPPDHIALQQGKSCCPCLGWDRCAHYGGSECLNFSSPDTVVEAICQMINGLHTKQDRIHPPAPSSKCPGHFLASPQPPLRPLAALPLPAVYTLLLFQVPQVLPRLAFTLVKEFIVTVRRDGLRKALYLTGAFLRRHVPGSQRLH